MIRIAVDAMGGDHGLPVTVPASLALLRALGDLSIILVGRQQEVEAELARHPGAAAFGERLTVLHAEEVVGMDEPPATALRQKKQSSMRLAIMQVRDGKADVCVSAGNTGALMAISRFVLRTLPGIDRPAIAGSLPNHKGGATWMLDLGANVDCTPEHLRQFALMGSAVASAVDGLASPRIGLLNIGEEAIKGNDVVKQAAELLRASPVNFIGNVEGNQIFEGVADVVVCDGFVGNVALKTTEGLARMIVGMLREEFSRSLITRAAALMVRPVLRRFRDRGDHRRYNGASLVGLQGVVIKSHGGTDVFGFQQALRRGYEAAHNGLLVRITEALAQTHQVASTPTGHQAQPA